MQRACCPSRFRQNCRGFTLLESLMASGILLMVVVAVSSALMAGQQHALEAQQRIAGSLAAEELMNRLIAQPYDLLPSWNGYSEAVGAMTGVDGQPLPDAYRLVGRDVQVTTALRLLSDVDVRVRGRNVRVRSFDSSSRVLSEITRFIPEPQS